MRECTFRARARAWFFLFRPWSYTATVVPFLVAAAPFVRTHADAHPDWMRWALGFVSGLFFQATVNLLNTWGDERSGVDNVPGAIRTTPQVHEGLISLRQVGIAALVCAALAAISGVGLCWTSERFNWALLAFGFIGFLGSTNYSTGIKFKYRGLGVPFVSFLMGPLEIAVALALIAPEAVNVSLAVLWSVPWRASLWVIAVFFLATLPVALLVGVIMHGNDMRDIPTDRAAGIRTLASMLGARGALVYYRACHALPYVVLILDVAFMAGSAWMRGAVPQTKAWAFLLPLAAFPLSLKTMRAAGRTWRERPENPPWRGLERASGGVHFVFGILYALALAF